MKLTCSKKVSSLNMSVSELRMKSACSKKYSSSDECLKVVYEVKKVYFMNVMIAAYEVSMP